LVDLVYNKGTGTVIILDNQTTAMTGHQDHPGTGFTIKKEQTSALDFAEVVSAIGVKRVSTVDPYDLEGLERVIREELATEEVSVIISKRPCVLLGFQKSVGRIKVNADKCEGCRRCLQLACPALSFAGDRVSVNEEICNCCSLCVQVCPHQALEVGER
jgi:indolepyruvate ferredoxin oxidoreductase alpha subunit